MTTVAARRPAPASALAPVGRVIRTAWEWFPLTPGGVVALVLGFVAWRWYGVGDLDLILLVVGGVSVFLALLAAISVFVTAVAVFVGRRNERGEGRLDCECSHPSRTGYAVPSLWWMPFAQVTWTWESPEADVKLVRRWGRMYEQVTPNRRGEAERIVRKVDVEDPFGLGRVTFRIVEERRLRFVPTKGALKNMQVVHTMAGGDQFPHPEGPPHGDLVDMRNYTAGDPIRYVLWKVYAKNRHLVVRTPERALAPVTRTVAFLVAGLADEAAAGAARVAVDAGALGDKWVLGVDGADQVATNPGHALDLIVKSGRVQPEDGGKGLASFLANAMPGGVRRAVVFVPPKPGPWLARVLAAAGACAGQAAPLEFVVCTDGVGRSRKRNLLWRMLVADASDPRQSSADEVAEVVSKLAASRSRVTVVDRLEGRVFGEHHLRALGVA